MKPRAGFSTAASLGLLLLLLALVALATSMGNTGLLAEQRTRQQLERQDRVWKVVETTLAECRENWDPSRQLWIDFVRDLQLDLPVDFEDPSSRVNLNSVNTFLLSESPLRFTLKDHTVEEFQEFRLKEGPFSWGTSYESYFDAEALKTEFSTWSIFDVNTVDELVAERVATVRADAAVGAALRESLRSVRQNLTPLDASGWETLLRTLDPRLEGLFGTEPEVNVNTAPAPVLEAILSYPALSVADPVGKAATLVAERARRPWTSATLASFLGVEKGARVLQYLGTTSPFLMGSVRSDGRLFRFVVQSLGTSGDRPEFRLVSQGWVP